MIERALAATGLDLSRVGGPIGDAARALAPTRQQRAEWAALARAPVPPGVRGVHASWIEHALAALPPRARDALARGGGDPVDVWLVRWACAELVAMPPLGSEGVLGLDATAVEAWLRARGDEQVALVARAASGQGSGPEMRAAIACCRGTTDRLIIGARAAAPQLGAHAQVIALRLPRTIGLAVREQMMSATWRTPCNGSEP